MAQEVHKPMFFLKMADGAIGAHANAVQVAYQDFQRLARRVLKEVGLGTPYPQPTQQEELLLREPPKP